jgi:site-specific DNA recombinase
MTQISVQDTAATVGVEEAIRQTTEELRRPNADFAVLIDRLSRLHAERTRILGLPTTPSVERIETGRTFREAWTELDMLGRRRIYQEAGLVVALSPARQRGRWDPERVQISFGAPL